LPKEGRMPKKWCPYAIRIKEDSKQSKGFGCAKGDGTSYPFPCPLGNLRGCPKAK
jgi:hypothetical protein